MHKLYIILFVVFVPLLVFGQNAKKFQKTADDFYSSGQISQAIEFYTKSLEIDPNHLDSYLGRAKALLKTEDYQNALDDYEKLIVLDPKNDFVYLESARINYELNRLDSALMRVNQANELKRKNEAALELKVKILISKNDFYNALTTSDELLKIDETPANLHMHGVIYYKLNDKTRAKEYFKSAIDQNNTFVDAYVYLARIQVEEKELNQAMVNVNEALKIANQNAEAYVIRSRINKLNLNLAGAINDISQAILIKPANLEYYFVRAEYYADFSQFQNAINDYNKILFEDRFNADALYKRAQANEQIGKLHEAIKDYNMLAEMFKDNPKYLNLLNSAAERLYELNRENKKPEITVVDPVSIENMQIMVPRGKNFLLLKGIVADQSGINYLRINNKDVKMEPQAKGLQFETEVDLSASDIINIACEDAYGNLENVTFTVLRTEINPPAIEVLAPYASDNDVIYLSDNSPNLYIEGKIEDESLIKEIYIDGVIASYRPEDINPSFSASLNIANKNSFTITVKDKYGNTGTRKLLINRDDAMLSADNPMGKTWIVFIENSNYHNFASLDGPTKDISLMKTALVNYQIHNYIHKKDMSKSELERFFSIELRDLVRSNRVNSIMVWYAGHGKFINETGYWIPVDAQRDDEFTYFNINALKASLQAYSKYITHTLVITDACETGPAFYTAMRSTNETRSCDDFYATQFKSSQVFSSAGYELAVDNSQFTRTFAGTLANNPNMCIPIEDIVRKVTDAVTNNNQQKPKFGKISGMEDENGTFFFIAK